VRWTLVLASVCGVLLVGVLALVLVARVLARPPVDTVLYRNAMTAKSADWPNDAECFFRDDGYHIVRASNCYYGADFGDATVTVSAKMLRGDASGAYGIAFRRPSPNNFYLFYVTGTGKWLVMKNDAVLRQSARSGAIKTGVGATNILQVRMKGNHFEFYANGTRLGALDDGTYATGKVGLAGDQNLEVAFTDFTVTQG
jgi:hypothetical protein